jgi:uncharacterized membrane protein
VTCDGAKRIAAYSKPLAIFITVIVIFVGGAKSAGELYQKNYGHFAGVILGTLLVAAILYSLSTSIGDRANDLSLAVCGQNNQ